MVRGVQKTKKQIQQKTNHGVVYGQEKDHGTTYDAGGDKIVLMEKDPSRQTSGKNRSCIEME